MRRIYFAILATAFALSLGNGFISPAAAAAPKSMATPCRDKMGKFTKCKPAPMKPAPKKTPCRDKMGKFTKCK